MCSACASRFLCSVSRVSLYCVCMCVRACVYIIRVPILFRVVYVSHSLSALHVSVSVCIYVCVCTGWRCCTGCLKLQVSFHKRATNYRALLRKITCKDKASYGSSPPCMLRVPFFLCFACHFLPKSPMISGSFVERDPQLKASYAFSPPCMCLCLCTSMCARVHVDVCASLP